MLIDFDLSEMRSVSYLISLRFRDIDRRLSRYRNYNLSGDDPVYCAKISECEGEKLILQGLHDRLSKNIADCVIDQILQKMEEEKK